MKKTFSNLTFWVVLSIILGIILGHFFPKIALISIFEKEIKFNFLLQDYKIGHTLSEVLSGTFISIVKFFIIPIIFVTISLGIIQSGDLKKVGKLGFKSILYFEIVTTLALLIGFATCTILQPGKGILPVANTQKIPILNPNTEFNFLQLFNENPTLLVLIFSILFGIIVSKFSIQSHVLPWLTAASSYLFTILHKVMLLAPVGAFGGICYTIAKYGLHAILPLAYLLFAVYLTMFLFVFVVLGLLLRMYHINIWKFLVYMKEELLIVLGTSSSEPALPNLMEKLEKMGCKKEVVGVVVPAGYSFNLDGTSIYLSMGILFLAQVYNISLNTHQILVLIGLLMLTSKGAAGVTGSGLIILTSTLTSFQLIPTEGIALLLGIDRFMSEIRAITNFIGNGVATIWLSNQEKSFDRSKMNTAFNIY
jgi:aerobic C4-dicarboxylate transport protein